MPSGESARRLRILGGDKAGAGNGQGHSAGVDGNPAPAPLLRHIGSGAAAAGGVQHQVAGVRGHEETAFYYPGISLDSIMFVICSHDISPNISHLSNRKIIQKANEP